MKKVLLFLVAMFAFGLQNTSAQDGIKIVTNHPDLKIKVKRCAASGKTVILDLVMNNVGVNDVEKILVYGGCSGTEAYDDDGNIYQSNAIKVRVANRTEYECGNTGYFNIPAGVPIKLSVSIEGVPQSAESIARLKLIFVNDAWSLGRDKPVRINNIPISRD